MRGAGIVLLAAAGCAAPDPAPHPIPREASGNVTAPVPVPVLPYDGRCAKDPRFPERVEEMQGILAVCVDEVRTRLGLLDHPAPRLRVRFQDTRFYGRHRQYGAKASVEAGDGANFQTITIRTEPFLSGDADPSYLLRHEVVHSCHQKAFGAEMDRLPPWVVEGLAEWGTGRGPERLEAELLDVGSNPGFEPVGSLIRGLSRGWDPCYAEFNLAFQMMEERFGAEAVRQFSRELAVVGDVSRALRRSTGRDLVTFEREARAWSEARVRRCLEDRDAYLPAREAFGRKEWAVARALYDRFLDAHPTSFFLPIAILERAECRLETGDAEGMEGDLKACEDAEPLRGLWNNRRRWLRLRRLAREERWAEVERDGSAFVADYDMGGGLYHQGAYVMVMRARDELAGRKPWK